MQSNTLTYTDTIKSYMMFIKNEWLFCAPACATIILLNTILFTVTPILLQNDIAMNIIYLLFTLDLGVIGFILSSIYVSKYVYKPMKYIEDEQEKKEEINYEEQYDIDNIEDISGNPSETVYISDMTPDGIAFMRYNKYKEGFEYWAEKSIKYDYLETICRKFVKFYRCKNMYIDRKRLLKEKKERAEEKRKREEELKEMEKEDFVKLNENDDDEDEDVFAKLKTNVDKRYESKSKKDKANENVVDQANKFIYMGKLNEMLPFTTKRTDELSAEKEKKEMSFSMFKRMGF